MTLDLAVRPSSALGPVARPVVGYLRESRGSRPPRGFTEEQRAALRDRDTHCQRLRIRDRAQRDGYDPEAIVWNTDDVNRSGSRGSRRPGWERIKADIRNGRLEAVYTSDISRSGRDQAEHERFWYLTHDHGVRWVDCTDQTALSDQTPDALYPRAAATEAESRMGRERARGVARPHRTDTIAIHRASCTARLCPDTLHWDGQPPYGTQEGEDIEAVIDAYRETGEYGRAAERLNVQGTPTRGELRGYGGRWWAITVQRIIGFAAIHGLLDGRVPATAVALIARRARAQRAYTRGYSQARVEASRRGLASLNDLPVHLLPARVGRGRARRYRPLARHALAHLVRCPRHGSDDVRLTATWRTTRRGREVGLFCSRCRGIRDAAHRPYSVSEHIIRSWVQAATAGVLGLTVLTNEPDTAAQLADIERRSEVLDNAHHEGFIEEETYRRRQADLDAERAGIESADRTSTALRLGIDWTLPDADLNIALLDLLHSVELGSDYRPVAFVWTREPVQATPMQVIEYDEGSMPLILTDNDPEAAPLEAARVPGGWRIAWTPIARSNAGSGLTP